MNRSRFLLLAAGVLAVCFLAYLTQRSSAVESAPNDVVAQLKTLQEKVAKLETRVAELEKRPAYVLHATPGPNSSTEAVPKDWIPKEFNGMTYYIVPVKSNK